MKKKPATWSSTKRLEVYDFDASDDVVQSSAQKIVNKYSKIINVNKPIKSRNHSPVTKYNFLRCFAQGTGSKPKELSSDRLEVEDDDDTIKERLSCFDEIASSGSTNCVSATPTKSELVTINIDDDDIESSASTSSSKLAGNEGPLEEQALENHFTGCAIDNDVVVWPDYIIYGERYSTECQITFTSSCIKVECSAVCGDNGSFCIEWTVGDIIKIESQWCDQFQTAAVNLLVKLGDNKLAEDAEMSRGTAELRFAVFDPCWHKQQETIKSLNTQYKTKWIVVSDIDARSKDGCLEKNNIFISKHCFTNHDESVKEVVYPRGDPDAVSISTREIELLQPERFINDTVIDFYIKYLENKIKPEEKHRFHFFNCFFFRKLADLDKDRCGAGDGSAAFQRVRKWTRKVNLFEKDYMFIPVNFSLHWSLIVICHPGDAANFEDEDMQNLPKVPCILHMDSIKGSHRGLKNLFQSYLWEEWKERGNQPGDVSSKFLNLQFVPLELPQQENSFDCGIFLLHYMELFLEHAPFCFNPFKKQEFPNFLSKNWFPPVEASLKRAYIKDLIDQIAEDYYEKAVPAACDTDDLSPEVLIVEEKGTDAELPEETCRSPKIEICHMNYCSSISDLENGTEPLRGTPNRGCVECSKERDSCRRSLFDKNCPFVQMISRDRLKNIMTPIEEVGETSEQQAKFEGSSSSGMEVNENHLFNDILGSNSSETTQTSDESVSPSTASGELTTCIVEDSEEEDGVIDITEERSLFGLRKVKGTSRSEGGPFICVSIEEGDSCPVLELDKRLGSKRRSPVPPVRVGRRLRSSSKDVQEVFLCE